MTTSAKTLEQRIENAVEQVVRAHLAAVEKAASVAVVAGVRRAMQAPSRQRASGTRSQRRAASRRRSPEEVAALEEQLYEAINAHPGETMTVIAASMGSRPRDLSLPANRLRQAGRVRSVGQRQSTRYFAVGE